MHHLKRVEQRGRPVGALGAARGRRDDAAAATATATPAAYCAAAAVTRRGYETKPLRATSRHDEPRTAVRAAALAAAAPAAAAAAAAARRRLLPADRDMAVITIRC